MYSNKCTNFIDNFLPKHLLETDEFTGQKFLKWEIKVSKSDFGFMSTIYDGKFITTDEKNEKEHQYQLIIKVMKGNEDFRIKSQSYLQFQNEIFAYKTILPFFKRYLTDKKNITFNPENWTPKTFLNICIPKDNGKSETILVQENIQQYNFRVSESLYLTKQHFDIMIDYLAELHSVSLALKIRNDKDFETTVVQKLTPLCFEDPSGKPCLYDVLYEIATTRLFENVFSSNKYHDHDEKFLKNAELLKKVVGTKPVKLLEHFRKIDKFSVIVHGDFNRNNLMFQYDEDGNVKAMRMIDFQQVRYGSPCLDLAFFMYLNMDPVERPELWNKLIAEYHQKLISHTAIILNTSTTDTVFDFYNYNDFLNHCQKFFLYGTLISISYTPWLLTTKEETEQVGKLFEQDMFNETYRAFAFKVGGEKANKRMVEDLQHASKMGYLDMLQELA